MSLNTGKVLGIVYMLRGCGCVEAMLGHPDAFRGVEPDKGDRRTPQVLYNSERHVASPSHVPQRLGAAGSHEPHVSGLPRVRFPSRAQSPASLASYALYL